MATQFENQTYATGAIAASESANRALVLYHKLVNRLTQWESVKVIIDDLTNFRNGYSKDGAVVVGEIKTLMMDASIEYLSAAQSIC